jgi:dUTP pyrophosphatase
MAIKFLKVRDVKTPERGTPEAAGVDFFVPAFNVEFLKELKAKNPKIAIQQRENYFKIILLPNERVMIPSGIKTWIPEATALIAANKSGVATKKGLIFGAQVVDSDYAGEVHISVINAGNEVQYIEPGEKLIQFIHTPVLLSEIESVNEEEFTQLHDESLRGEGGFGSTGTK